jgi:hypothetical protein
MKIIRGLDFSFIFTCVASNVMVSFDSESKYDNFPLTIKPALKKWEEFHVFYRFLFSSDSTIENFLLFISQYILRDSHLQIIVLFGSQIKRLVKLLGFQNEAENPITETEGFTRSNNSSVSCLMSRRLIRSGCISETTGKSIVCCNVPGFSYPLESGSWLQTL